MCILVTKISIKNIKNTAENFVPVFKTGNISVLLLQKDFGILLILMQNGIDTKAKENGKIFFTN